MHQCSKNFTNWILDSRKFPGKKKKRKFVKKQSRPRRRRNVQTLGADISRGIATADRRGKHGLAGARSPSEVKVRCVGTGCARIHFFGLTVHFFSTMHAASVPMYTLPTQPIWPARDIFPHVHIHIKTEIVWPLSPSLLSLSLSFDRSPLIHLCAHGR